MRQADCSGRFGSRGWGAGGIWVDMWGALGAQRGSRWGPLTGIGSTELAGGLLQSCHGSVCASLSQLPPSAPRLTCGCGGTRPANLESGARATLCQLPGFTSSQRQLGGRGGTPWKAAPGGLMWWKGRGVVLGVLSSQEGA